METTVIHIGYHKSASTFLQQQVFPKLPVNYVFFSGENRQYLDMIESTNGLDSLAIQEWIEKEISQKYPTGKHSITVLSHEELSGHPHGYKRISAITTAVNLKETFPDAKILIIIRNQLDYMTSLYTFRVAVKGHETRGFARFLREEGEKGLFDHLEYHRLVELYHQLFGRENVTVIPMEVLLRSSEDFYHRLFEFLQIPTQKIQNTQPSNVSTKILAILGFWQPINYLFGQILSLLRLIFGERPGNFPRFRSSYYELKRKVTRILNRVLSKGRQLEIDSLPGSVDFVERFSESNSRLNKLLDMDLSQFGYPVKNS